MSTKSKRRIERRLNKDEVSSTHRQPHVTPVEQRATGALVGALLNAITFGALEPVPQSAPGRSA